MPAARTPHQHGAASPGVHRYVRPGTTTAFKSNLSALSVGARDRLQPPAALRVALHVALKHHPDAPLIRTGKLDRFL